MRVADIIAETRLDLSNPKIGTDVLAGEFFERFRGAFPDVAQLEQVIKNTIKAVQGITAKAIAPNAIGAVLGVYSAAIAAVGAAKSILEGRLDDDISGNFLRLEQSRNLAVQTYVRPGDWSVCGNAGGLPVGEVDLYNQVGGWGEQQFLDQYNPGIVWMSHRSGKSDILLPTWHSHPYTDGYGLRTGEQGTDFPVDSPLTGYWRHRTKPLEPPERTWMRGQPNCDPFSNKYDDDYFGTMPSATQEDLAALQGPVEGAFKALQRMQQKMDEAFYKRAFVPPPDYWYLWSVGTYPYTSWNTAAGYPAPWGSPVTLNSTMAAMAAGIHSISPLHAAVRASEVEQCYRAWSAAVHLSDLPPLGKQQPDGGKVYLDEAGLPYAVADEYGGDSGSIWAYSAKRPEYAQDPLAPPGKALSFRLNWQAVRSIELSFRSFFRIRRAVLYQFNRVNEQFRLAALASADPILRSVAQGKPPPPYRSWDERNPLGVGLPPPPDPLKKNGNNGNKNGPGSGNGGSGLVVGLAGVAGAAAIAAYFIRKRKRQGFSAGRQR